MTDDLQAALASSRRMSHGEQLARAARKHPDKVAFRFRDRQLTFSQLDERVTRLAHALQDRGVQYGDRVAILMMNCLEAVESLLACCRLGALGVPINFRLVADEVTYLIEDSGSKVILVDDTLAELAGRVRERVPALAHCLVTSGDPARAGNGAEPYHEAVDAASAEPMNIDVPEHDPAFIMYTSGTTGRPKGAVLTHFNLLMNSFNMMTAQGVGGDDEVWLSGLPLFHIAGVGGILPYIMLAGKTVLMPSGHFDPEEVVDLLEKEQITGCYFVPSQWQQICAVPGIEKRDLKLRRISWGASPATPSVLKAMAETFPGVPNINAFGQTEASPVTCLLLGDDAIRKMGSIGKPIANIELRLVDDHMNEVPRGEVGEIVYRGPTIFPGYWNRPDANEEAFRGGWFHSGDMAREDEEGFLYVVDRKKDMIISGGENIYCAEVEACIDGHPKVREVAVIGVPHEKWVETPMALIVPVDAGDPPSGEEIIDYCREHIASYKKPTRVEIVDELPRNASGKVMKFRLRESYGGKR
ncbi:MAG TPA: long-chain-fatty-acid--CoA ligase [Gammaproteobacteria bacterium]|nr:long-chain-fatty-acid--CoA ligase [Gammaproteobacteria bacterium]